MAEQLYRVEHGVSDGRISYLSGSGAPGGDSSFQDEAGKGSLYADVVSGIHYKKHTTGTGADKWGILATTEKLVKTVTQAAHGLVSGDWVLRQGGSFVKGQANDANTSDVVGIVESISGANEFDLVIQGFSEVTSAEAEASPLFLSSDTAGSATTTKPTTGVQKNLGFVVDGKVFVAIGMSVEISEGEAPSVPLILLDDVTVRQTISSVNTKQSHGALWVVTATKTTAPFARNQLVVNATHDGQGSTDATDAGFQIAFDTLVGSVIDGLAIGVSLSGTGNDQLMDLHVVSTSAVDVAVRQISVEMLSA